VVERAVVFRDRNVVAAEIGGDGAGLVILFFAQSERFADQLGLAFDVAGAVLGRHVEYDVKAIPSGSDLHFAIAFQLAAPEPGDRVLGAGSGRYRRRCILCHGLPLQFLAHGPLDHFAVPQRDVAEPDQMVVLVIELAFVGDGELDAVAGNQLRFAAKFFDLFVDGRGTGILELEDGPHFGIAQAQVHFIEQDLAYEVEGAVVRALGRL